MPAIHATAIVEAGARLGEGVEIGPFCHVGPEVELGDRVKLHSHVVVAGRTRVGEGSRIFPFASIGHAPQDLKYAGEPSRLEIGRDNVIREHVTMNPGTAGGGLLTRVGDGCLFMVGAHVAHDCQVGDRVILANNATLAGHVQVGEQVIIGGLSAVRQFVRIGRNAMIGGMSGIENDVIPYGLAMGERARLSGLNLVGLKRRGFARSEIQALMEAYERLFEADGTLGERAAKVAESHQGLDTVREVVAFVQGESSLGLCQPRPGNGGR